MVILAQTSSECVRDEGLIPVHEGQRAKSWGRKTVALDATIASRDGLRSVLRLPQEKNSNCSLFYLLAGKIEQIEIMEEAAFEREPGAARVSQNYVKAALSALMPVVLETLLKQDEDSADDSEHWDLGLCRCFFFFDITSLCRFSYYYVTV